MSIAIYIAVMADVNYLIRLIPFAIYTKKIESKFLKSFLYDVRYAVLTAMTVPAIVYSTGNTVTATVGTAVALILASFNLPLIAVALSASAAAFITGIIIL